MGGRGGSLLIARNVLHERTQLCYIHLISRLVQLEEKTLTHVNAIPQLLLHKHSHSLTSPCHDIVGELHFFDSFNDLCVIFNLPKEGCAASRKAFFTLSPSFNGFLCLASMQLAQGCCHCSLTLRFQFGEDQLPCYKAVFFNPCTFVACNCVFAGKSIL